MLLQKAKETIKKFHMLKKSDSVVVGVSGGADSVALLHVLFTLQKEYDLTLQAVHVHHGLRGAEADRDLAFVEQLCQMWQIPCASYYFNVAAEAVRRGVGEEEAGRQLRYAAFYEEACGGKIAVAHNRNDQAETVLMRLCRGAGMTGLAGIAPVRGTIIRPLLFCSRKEIEAYCQKEGLDFCDDRTNKMEIYTRNKIRLGLLPWMEREINKGVVEHIARTAQLLAEEEDFLEKAAKKALEDCMVSHREGQVVLQKEALKKLHPALRRRTLRRGFRLLERDIRDLSFTHMMQLEELLDKETGKQISLALGLGAEIQYDNLRLFLNNMNKTGGYCYEISPKKTIFIKETGKFVRISFNAEKNRENPFPVCTKVFDYDKIDKALCCRTRQPGDRLSIGGGHEKKLKDFMIDEKIPREDRERIPLIACGAEILWVVGYRTAEKFSVDETTKNILSIQIWEEKGNEGKSGDLDHHISHRKEA